jgi:hypothetical protein
MTQLAKQLIGYKVIAGWPHNNFIKYLIYVYKKENGTADDCKHRSYYVPT